MRENFVDVLVRATNKKNAITMAREATGLTTMPKKTIVKRTRTTDSYKVRFVY